MNKEDYVSLEVAKLLKEKGYDKICQSCYVNDNFMCMSKWVKDDGCCSYFYPAPTLYEAQKWLWQKHELLVNAFLEAPFAKPHLFAYYIQDSKNSLDDYGTKCCFGDFESYEQAFNAGILEALKLI